MFSFFFRQRRAEPVRAQSKLRLESLEDRTVPATFVVSQVNDSGEGTLRDAVQRANESAGVDVITFDSSIGSQAIILTSGELAVTDDLIVDGNGATVTGITTNRTSRVFNVENPNRPVSLQLLDLQLFAASAQGDGGAVRVAGGSLLVQGSAISDSSANKGGAIAAVEAHGFASQVQIINSNLSSNRAQKAGGMVHVDSQPASTGLNLSIVDSYIVQNSVTDPSGTGGAINIDRGNAAVEGSTVAQNSSTGEGGAIHVGLNGVMVVNSSTLHVNASTGGLGGGAILSRGQLSVFNSTITKNNDASSSGAGGIRHVSGTPMQLSSTIVAENTGTTTAQSRDVQTTVNIASDGHNLIGHSAGVSGLSATDLVDIDPKLGPLHANGGVTPTRVPLPGSPVIGRGSNPLNEANDQRGTGFSRATQGAVDIGAVQFNAANIAPTAAISSAPNVTIGSASNVYNFTVKYTDETKVSSLSLDQNDITVYGPNGFTARATPVNLTPVQTAASEFIVQYRIVPPNGIWNGGANGTYTIVLNANEVLDERGRPVVGPVTLGAFVVNMPGDDAGFVQSLYTSILGRDGDEAGIEAFTKRINAGESREAIAREMWESTEHREMQVRQYYRDFLGRDAEADGIAYWVSQFKNGAKEEDVMAAIASSEEFRNTFQTPASVTGFLYNQFLNRSTDDLALNYYSVLQTGNADGTAHVVRSVALSTEAMEVQVSKLYQQILLRDADEEGKADFVAKSRSTGIAEAAIGLIASDEYFQLHGSTV